MGYLGNYLEVSTLAEISSEPVTHERDEFLQALEIPSVSIQQPSVIFGFGWYLRKSLWVGGGWGIWRTILRSAQKYLQSRLHTNVRNSYRLWKYPECLFNNLGWYLHTSRCLVARPCMTWLWTEVLLHQVRHPRLDPICWNIIDLVPARAGISDPGHEISRWFGIHIAQWINKLPVGGGGDQVCEGKWKFITPQRCQARSCLSGCMSWWSPTYTHIKLCFRLKLVAMVFKWYYRSF